MAWRAWIESVRDNPVPSENIFVGVKFEDTVIPRVMVKEYKFVVGTTRAQFEALVLSDRNAMRTLDTVKATLLAAIGTEVT